MIFEIYIQFVIQWAPNEISITNIETPRFFSHLCPPNVPKVWDRNINWRNYWAASVIWALLSSARAFCAPPTTWPLYCTHFDGHLHFLNKGPWSGWSLSQEKNREEVALVPFGSPHNATLQKNTFEWISLKLFAPGAFECTRCRTRPDGSGQVLSHL
jgi:hypothetical protein